ncbi:MAG: DUF4340 domain-containing protein [Oscillospiraceae bacterium]|nr:DUF4340 domain-containing protein [Oscillospiraceae bacterium]
MVIDMKNNLQIMLISLIGVAVLGATVLILHFTQPRPDDNPEPAEPVPASVKTVFADFLPEDVEKITLFNLLDKDGYTVSSDGNDGYTIPELNVRSKNVPYNQLSLLNLAADAASLSSVSTVEENTENSDLAKYGLGDSPRANIKVTFRDGTELAFSLGGTLPVGSGVYLMVEGDENVYELSGRVSEGFLRERHYWVERLAFPQYDSFTTPVIERVTVFRPNESETPLIIEALPQLPLEESRTFNTHRITEPISTDLHPERSSSAIYGIFGLTAAEVAWIRPEEIDMEFTGLGEPSCRVEVEFADSKYTLIIGDAVQGIDSSRLYGMSSEVPDVVFIFAAETLPWIDVQPKDIISSVICTPYIFSLERLLIETDTLTYDFEIIGDTDQQSFLINGEELAAARNSDFKDLYEFVIRASGDELFFEDGGEELILRISYVYRDKSRDNDVLEFYASSNLMNIVRINGNNLYKTKGAYSARLLANVEAFIAGEEIVTVW